MNTTSVNRITLLGTVSKEPEAHRVPSSGNVVARLVVLTEEQWTDRITREPRSRQEYHQIVMFGQLAQICEQSVTNGQLISIEGRNQTRKWIDRQGQERWTTEIVANSFSAFPVGGAYATQQPAPAPAQPAPAQPAPAQPTPAQPTPAQPLQPAPAQPAPGQPLQPAPAQPAPAQPAPAQPSPPDPRYASVHPAGTDSPSQHPPTPRTAQPPNAIAPAQPAPQPASATNADWSEEEILW